MVTNLIEYLAAHNPLAWLYAAYTRSALRILAYHEVDYPENFDAHLTYLKRNYNIVSVHDVRLAILENKKLPPRSLLITFDDGERSVYENGLPLFVRHKIPACVFIVTQFIGSNRPLWWQSLRQLYEGEQLRSKLKAFKKLTHSGRLTEISKLERELGKKTVYPQLTNAELKQMDEADVCIANHTHTHPLLDQCTAKEILDEITLADSVLKDNDFSGRKFFAYPNGNYTPGAERVFRSIGIDLAFLFDHKLNVKTIDPYRISRLSVNSNTSINKLKFILSGLHSKVIGLYQ